MSELWSWVEGTHGMRTTMLDGLSDADLSYTPGGDALTLGALFREIGEIEHSYLQSFKTFKQDFSYRNGEAGLETSKDKLKAWYEKLDGEMKTTLEAFSADDLKKSVDRGGFEAPLEMQTQIYLQALLIFLGKVTVYYRIMGKPLPQSVQDWIG
jgi:hypothetical protein